MSILYLAVFAVLLILYLGYYFSKCGRPVLYAEYQSCIAKNLLESCPTLSKTFYPSLLFVQPDLQSLTAELREYFRVRAPDMVSTTITLEDGGEVFYTEPVREEPYQEEPRLVAVIVPGYMGDHNTAYVTHLASLLLADGIWPVIFTDRGKGGLQLKTTKFFSAGCNDGLEAVLDKVIDTHPSSYVTVIGISFGGMVACNTLYSYHRKDRIAAQILLSTPLDSGKCVKRLGEMGRAKFLYSIPFGTRVTKLLSENEQIFSPCPVKREIYKRISSTKSVSLIDIDSKFVAPMLGYNSSEEYYNDICLRNCFKDIDIYTVCINADDDPCFPRELYPLDLVQHNPNISLISTRAGGHYGFAGLGWPFKTRTFADDLVLDIVSMIRNQLPDEAELNVEFKHTPFEGQHGLLSGT